MVPITLKDGTHIPKGTRIAWPGPQHAFDPKITPDPETFDPMRSYRKRHDGNGENLQKFMAGQTNCHKKTYSRPGQ